MSNIRISRRGQALAAVLVAAVALGAITVEQFGGRGIAQENSVAAEKHVEQARDLSKAFKFAASKALPTVVTIKSRTKAKRVVGRPGGGENPFKGTPFEDLFDGEMGEMPQQQQQRQGLGSGVIIDKSGLVLTNNHVVQGADEVIVHLPDGREFKGEDIKTDDQTDLAVIRIKGAGSLPAAKLGDSDALEIGDWVLAIGAPFELEQTVSQGIISGKGRELKGAVRRASFLQTDAAINPGNSGGPLVNLEGEVIAINTAIATNNGMFSGIGFAIPINTAKWIVPQLVSKGSVERAYLGVEIQPVDSEVNNYFNVKSGQGVLVTNVLPNTPAAEAGLQPSDIILSIGGREVHGPRELQEAVERAPIGSKQKLEVLREGKRETVELRAKSLPKQFASGMRPSRRGNDMESSEAYENPRLGISVSDVPEDRVADLGGGVVVSSVDPNSAAAEKGIRRGAIIKRVGSKTVKNVADFKAAVAKVKADSAVLLLVRTAEGQRFLSLPVTDDK